MALTIGSPCPSFDGLLGTDGRSHGLGEFKSAEVLVIVVSCNHCPYVVAYEERLVAISRAYAPRKVRFLAVNANDAVRYPDDDMRSMERRARERGFDFPYVRDDEQTLVRALGARFTPEVFVFDRDRVLRYHGRIDDNHGDATRVRSHDLKDALEALLVGGAPRVTETVPVGCSVKWK